MMAVPSDRAPRGGRSYTTANGALVRVDHVTTDGDVLAVIWPTWWTDPSRDRGLIRYTSAEFAGLVEQHDLQPVAHPAGSEAA